MELNPYEKVTCPCCGYTCQRNELQSTPRFDTTDLNEDGEPTLVEYYTGCPICKEEV